MKISGEVVLITGGAGFIGSHLSEKCLNEGATVIVLDNFSEGRWSNLNHLKKHPNLKVVQGSITDTKKIEDCLKTASVVFHLAASFGNIRSMENPRKDLFVNVVGTFRLLSACLKHKVKRFVYASSSAIYGEPERIPIRESDRVRPLTPYGVSKLAGESYVTAFYETYGLPTVSLRLFNVYGPKDYPGKYRGVVANFIHQMMLGRRPTIRGDGNSIRDFTYVRDVINAHLLALKDQAIGKVFNIGTGKSTTILQLVSIINAILGMGIQPVYGNKLSAEVSKKIADIAKARKILGYEPTTSLEEGLKNTVNWFKTEPISRKLN